jgi:hypothetical protein
LSREKRSRREKRSHREKRSQITVKRIYEEIHDGHAKRVTRNDHDESGDV